MADPINWAGHDHAEILQRYAPPPVNQTGSIAMARGALGNWFLVIEG